MGFILGMLQMVLYGVYRNSGVKIDAEKKINSTDQQLKTIVVISQLGVSEVHPVDITVDPLSDAVHHEDPSKQEEPSIEDGKCHMKTSRLEYV